MVGHFLLGPIRLFRPTLFIFRFLIFVFRVDVFFLRVLFLPLTSTRVLLGHLVLHFGNF